MTLAAEARNRVERLALASPLYGRILEQHPEHIAWLEDARNLHSEFRYRALADEWEAFRAASGSPATEDATLGLLRRWRRLISLRIAYRSVNELASEPTTVAELSRLAEFCLAHVIDLARERWRSRLGQPWDEEADSPARFSVLGLGKLGGQELNFSSDIDLIFCYAGDGACRRDGPGIVASSGEFFTKLAETLIAMMGAPSPEGFLFRVDARLRPDGAHGPLVPSVQGIENYYASSGQTWERLALLKARTVGGDRALGAELLESLHPFRYPRHPPPSLLAEIAAMKRRTEAEIVGSEGLEWDVKLGRGGIREVEFLAQAFQVLHAGRNPFLQTHATTAALEQLARYQLLAPAQAASLQRDYWFLRRVEHRIQMRDEAQTHTIPEDPAEREAIAGSLGYADFGAFAAELAGVRTRIHAAYEALFAGTAESGEAEAWWTFLTTDAVPPLLAQRLRRWFPGRPDEEVPAETVEAVRGLARGGGIQVISPELVTRMQHLAGAFDELFPQLGRPLETLRRLERFAERYGTRRVFFETFAANPQLFRVLALLFDRSGYIHHLLCAHPEILEEVLRPEILRRRKTAAELDAELDAGPGGGDFPGWLWLYARAEQVRYAIGELLGILRIEELEAALSLLADRVLRKVERTVLRKGDRLLTVALGKYGGAELSFGSDLDLVFIAADADAGRLGPAVQAVRGALSHGGPLLPAFAVDFRLRPHGEAGPLVTSWTALREYHAGPSSQFWERQLLTRARVVAGPAEDAERFQGLVAELIYRHPPSAAEEAAIWAMRRRIQLERDVVAPPERAFKTGAGGLVGYEFLAQTFQLRHGAQYPSLRQPGTRGVLRELVRLGLIERAAGEELLGGYNFLKRIEVLLRRDSYTAESVLPASPAEREPLAKWLGFAGEAQFWAEYTRRLQAGEAGIRAALTR